jgi:crossover junction endodeoxyribonuclease RuvC
MNSNPTLISNNIWLGIDPGLAIIGWAILRGENPESCQLIDYGTIETEKGQLTAVRLLEIEQDLTEIVREFSPTNIALEMPFFSREIKAAGGVLQAVGVINLVCYKELKIAPILLHQASWKANLGHGKATKKEVAEIIQQLFNLEKLPIDDSVDAIAIALAGLCGVKNEIS